MAFMMPVLKNNYEIYPGKANTRRPRSRKSSTTSQSGGGGPAASGNHTLVPGRPGDRRPQGRSASESLAGGGPSPSRFQYSSSAPSSGTLAAAAARPQQRTVRFCRSVSSESHSGSGSRRSMEIVPAPVVFPSILLPRSGSLRSSTSSSNSGSSNLSGNEDSISSVTVDSSGNVESVGSPKSRKFHSRLIDKLKRKFRMKDDVDVCTSEDDSTVIRAST